MTAAELLSPAGDFETALAAFDAGADAVYCGLSDFSARAFAKNFTPDDLRNLLAVARARGKRVYVTFNTLLDEDAVEDAVESLALLAELSPDALIVQDLGVARLCRKYFPELALHASTQLVAHNLEGVLALRELGFTRVVLARELSCEEIASIARRCGGMELECFVHGALCYSVSGLCLFSAMEKERSGNRGKCAYCCRLPYETQSGQKVLAFSMKDLRLGEDVRRLSEIGVASLKIEGRMKSALYVASVTKYYRDILDGRTDSRSVTRADLETVFSRRTTELYFNGAPSVSPVDPTSLGHVGAEIGVVKRVTKDRDGLAWLRFHTARALEKHDGLQFEAIVDGRHLGMGIVEMRSAISRHPVFEVAAGSDVEILLPDNRLEGNDLATALKPGMKIFCSMSNAVKRRFPAPSFRPSDYAGAQTVDFELLLSRAQIRATAKLPGGVEAVCTSAGAFDRAKNPEKTRMAIEKAFAKLGGTDYHLGVVTVSDPDSVFAPMSVLNDLRRDLVERLDALRLAARRARIDAALDGSAALSFAGGATAGDPRRSVRLRPDQILPEGPWDEIVIRVDAETQEDDLRRFGDAAAVRPMIRLALPIYTREEGFNKLRAAVKRLARAGYRAWECADLATLRLLKSIGLDDLSADWTLYAFNANALAQIRDLGVRRVTASPENTRENLQYLAESGAAVDFLVQQSTPLFISLTKPAETALKDYRVFCLNGLWITTRCVPRAFDVPVGVSTRLDLSWDAPE